MQFQRFATSLCSAAVLLVLGCSDSKALIVNLTDGAPVYNVNVPGPCTGVGGPWPGCGVHSYLSFGNTQKPTDTFTNVDKFNSNQTASLHDMNFSTAFSAFGAANGWTLNEQPALANLTFNISTFRANADTGGGGLTIRVDVVTNSGYAGPALGQLVWSQGLLINYRPPEAAGINHDPPDNVMDDYSFSQGSTGSGGAFMNPCTAIPASPNNTTPSTIPASPANRAYCDPIYPFQFADKHFFDMPQGLYPIDSFRGEAFISTVNTTTKTLTVYDGGVNYGFDLFVAPEPGTFVLLFAGAALLVVKRRHART